MTISNEVVFDMLIAAYVRGNSWAHENGLGAEGVAKAAYDYADATTSELGRRTSQPVAVFDMLAYLARQREWSEKTFGPGPRTEGVIDHIRKELREIEADPSDISEWIDVVILALDGAWRAGYQPQQIIDAMVAKQTKNEARKWPDWRTMAADKAIEHDRTGEPVTTSPPSQGEPVAVKGLSKLKLWFFRDLFDPQRRQLFKLVGMPVDGTENLGLQEHMFKAVFAEALSPAPSLAVSDEMIFSAMAKADQMGEPLDAETAREILTAALSASHE